MLLRISMDEEQLHFILPRHGRQEANEDRQEESALALLWFAPAHLQRLERILQETRQTAERHDSRVTIFLLGIDNQKRGEEARERSGGEERLKHALART